MQLDSAAQRAPSCPLPDARGPPFGPASSSGYFRNREVFKFAGHGGARSGAGRPRNIVAPSPMPLDVFRWYCVRVIRGEERTADIDMRLAGFTLFAPTIMKMATPPRRDATTGVMRPGKLDRIEYMFRSFMFVSLNLSDPGWVAIKDVPGVDHVMTGADVRARASGIPIAIPDSAIEWIKGLLEPNGCMYPKNYPGHRHRDLLSVGTSQRMLTGGLTDQTGICEWSDYRRARLLFSILGREVRVTVERSAIEAV